MAFVLKDRVLETSVSTGTGDFVLGGAQTGYQGFSVVGNGATVPYTIQGKNSDGTLNGEWEVGEGTYYSSGNYITRDLVYESSNSNAKVAFSSGSKDIFLDLPSELISTVAITGSYTDLTNKPTIPAAQVNSDWTATSGVAEILHKPTLGTAAALDAGVPNGVATLDAGGKVPTSQIPQMGDLNYQGTWNASTNTPTLTSSSGTKGYYYVVNVAGTTNLDGITDWAVGDWAVFNGTVWQKIDNTDAVTSVNGYTGTVVLNYTDVGAAPATSGTSILYGDGSGGTSNVTVGTGLSFTGGTLSSSVSPMVYPGAGIPNSTGTAWGTSYTVTGTGTIVALQTNPTLYNPNIDVIDFDTTYATTLTAGQLGWDGNNTLGLCMAGGNVIQHIGEDQFFYCKASSAITKGQVVMFTGAVGASGVPTGAPATGITDGTYIMGIAAESIALNGFGLVQCFGTLRNVNTSGYSDGDILWYNPSVAGGLTKTKPSAPNVKVQMAAVINGGSSGGGTILIRINPGSTLGGTDSNAQITSPTNGQILTYDGAGTYWKNTTLTAGTGISVSAASDGTLTITNTSPSSGGTVTSVTGTAPIASTGGTTPAISISQATTSTDGYLSSTDWNTFNNKQPAGSYLTSVTADAPLSGSGTSGSHLVISQSNTSTNGYLSSTDWNTFNGKLSNPMTTLGDVIYGAASGTATRLAGNTTTAKQWLSQTGTGTVSAAPAWSALPTVLPVLNRAGSTVSVSVGNGVLPVLTRAGSTVNVAIN